MAQIAVGNYGFLSGLASGADSFLNAYMTTKNIQHKQKMEELMAGVQHNPDTGELEYTPQKQTAIQAAQASNQNTLESYNPESGLSTNLAQKRGLLAHAGNPNIPENTFEGISAANQPALEGLAKPDITGQYGMMGKQLQAQMMDKRLGSMIDQRQQRNQMSANQQYSKEMGATENQLLSANRVNALVQGIDAGKLQSTPQLKSDLSAALAQMLNAGKPATVYGMSHQEFDSAYGRAQKAYQFLTGTTGDSMTPQQLAQLQKDVAALAGEYQKQREVKFSSFKQGLPSQVTPGLENRYQTFSSGAGGEQKGLMSGSGLAQPKEGDTKEWQGKTYKVVNGHWVAQ